MNGKVTSYDVISQESRSNLISSVNRQIKDGWQPWGNLLILGTGEHKLFIQAIVKMDYSSKPDK